MNNFLYHHVYHHVAGLGRCIILMSAIALYSGNAVAEAAEAQELKLKVEAPKNPMQEPEPIKRSKTKTTKVTGNRWRSLQVNMSKAEVTSLLGKPGKIDKWKTGEAWYFPNPKGGEVDFDAEGKVSGWLDP
ncbi:MAG: hypothetical protein QX199_13315 [Methylococcaceae bacterium]